MVYLWKYILDISLHSRVLRHTFLLNSESSPIWWSQMNNLEFRGKPGISPALTLLMPPPWSLVLMSPSALLRRPCRTYFFWETSVHISHLVPFFILSRQSSSLWYISLDSISWCLTSKVFYWFRILETKVWKQIFTSKGFPPWGVRFLPWGNSQSPITLNGSRRTGKRVILKKKTDQQIS